jgi:hypothetical protein
MFAGAENDVTAQGERPSVYGTCNPIGLRSRVNPHIAEVSPHPVLEKRARASGQRLPRLSCHFSGLLHAAGDLCVFVSAVLAALKLRATLLAVQRLALPVAPSAARA